MEELRSPIAAFVERYNSRWLVARLAYRSPRQARHEARALAAKGKTVSEKFRPLQEVQRMSGELKFSEVPIDTVRDYWNRRPCNLRHSRQEPGTRQFFEEQEARKYLVESHIPGFADFPSWRGKRVLEIGCGLGADTINFARAGARVTAVDLSDESLNLARRRAETYGVEVQFYRANVERLREAVPCEPYDLVYSFGVLHHTPRPALAIQELKHYMHPGSTLKLMVYNRYSWKVFCILASYGPRAFLNADELIARHSEAQTGCPVTYTYTRKSIRELLPEFRIASADIEHIFPYRISDYVEHRFRKEWYFRYLPTPIFAWLERRLGWHLCVTAHPSW